MGILQSGPPVLPNNDQTTRLGQTAASGATLPGLCLGRRYLIDVTPQSALAPSHGLVGDYRIDIRRTEVQPVTTRGLHAACFFWDTDVSLPTTARPIRRDDGLALDGHVLQGNSIQVAHGALNGPELTEASGGTTLTLSPRFELVFDTAGHDAMAGVIHLVQAQRFVRLDDGTSIMLLDTHAHDAPVLYLEDANDERPVKTVVECQAAGTARTYDYVFRIGQAIPDHYHGRAVESVTVLEQYTSYFMQREIGQPENAVIWTPACAPIAWGWSIRVERRFDGPWCLARRKVMLPIGGHDGLDLPVWTTNTLACAR